jgi:hypothetical protein
MIRLVGEPLRIIEENVIEVEYLRKINPSSLETWWAFQEFRPDISRSSRMLFAQTMDSADDLLIIIRACHSIRRRDKKPDRAFAYVEAHLPGLVDIELKLCQTYAVPKELVKVTLDELYSNPLFNQGKDTARDIRFALSRMLAELYE